MKPKRVRAFLTIASEELDAARKLATPLPRQAQYFLQQAVEKLVRAVIEVEGGKAGVSHNLGYLAGLLRAGHELRERFESFDHLSGASTRYRYPNDDGKIAAVSPQSVLADLTEVEALDADVRRFCEQALSAGGARP
jgi:HEPN domain-containing protein